MAGFSHDHIVQFFLYSIRGIELESKSLIVFRSSNTAIGSNLSGWFVMNIKIFVKIDRPLSLHFWTFLRPLIKIQTFDPLWKAKNGYGSSFMPWFILDLKKLMKNREPIMYSSLKWLYFHVITHYPIFLFSFF